MQYRIRTLKESDLPQIDQLFIDTVHAINSRDYTPEQVAAWAPGKHAAINPSQACNVAIL